MKKHPYFLVYVAAPFSPTESQKARMSALGAAGYAFDPVQENKDAAALLGLEVAKLDCMPIVPHTATGGRPELESVQDYDFWIKGTAALLFVCNAALFSPNWQESSGARSEHIKCTFWGIPIFYTLDELRTWLEGSEILEDEALLSLSMRIGDRIADVEIPYRLPSELPLCGVLPKVSTAQAPAHPIEDFGKITTAPLPVITGYTDDDGGLDA